MNPYYDPEKCGLEIVGELDPSDAYEFDKLVVWRTPTDGKLWWAADSGCSCPSPFEDMEVDEGTPYCPNRAGMTRLLTLDELNDAIRERWPIDSRYSPDVAFIDQLKTAVKRYL